MEWKKGDFSINNEKSALDLDAIGDYLKQSYWASDRSRAKIEASIENSLCFGVFRESRQVGFARVVTDGSTFSWLCDVFILPEHQNNGLGKWLMECVVSHPDIANTLCLLGTRDAHGLYEKYGFTRREMMTRRPD